MGRLNLIGAIIFIGVIIGMGVLGYYKINEENIKLEVAKDFCLEKGYEFQDVQTNKGSFNCIDIINRKIIEYPFLESDFKEK